MRFLGKKLFFACILAMGVALLFQKSAFAAPDVSHSTFAANGTAQADGSSTITITITLLDSSDVAQVGDTVTLAAPSNSSAVFSPTSAITDGSGQVVFTMTSNQAGSTAIDVTDSTAGVTFSAMGSVQFTVRDQGSSSNSTPNIPTCTKAYPSGAPNFYQLSTASGSATLYFVQPQGNFDGYTISYGPTETANTYNTSFKMGSSSGSVKYTVNKLDPNIKYYFKVRADNDCQPGEWSQTLPKTVTKTLPVTGTYDSLMYVSLAGLLIISIGSLLVFKS